MRTITLQDIKRCGAKAIPNDAPIFLIVNSKPKSVLVPVEEYETLMEALEELEDIHAIEHRRKEKTIPYTEIFPEKK